MSRHTKDGLEMDSCWSVKYRIWERCRGVYQLYCWACRQS